MTGSDQKRFYVTTPIYYVNDKPHIGHAYTTLACDVLARFKRLDGFEVMFLTGTDEHGQKVEKAATDKGVTPQAFTDSVSQNFRDLTSRMNFSNDDFIRTTEARHRAACQKLWSILLERGHITLGSYAGWYAVRDEAFYTETEIVDGKAPTGAPVEWVEEPSYFFNLSQWQEPLLEFYEANPDFVGPASRFNEVKSFVSGGLRDLSVSRASFSWGVPVPDDDAHVMYVWLDALTNYLTATGWPVDGDFGDKDRNERFWQAARCRASVVRMKSSLEKFMRDVRSRKFWLTLSVKACGVTPLSVAAFSTFWPCSSVPVRNITSNPSRRLKRASTSQARVV